MGYNDSMTQVSRDDVLGLAKLSSLQLADDEIENLTQDIANILGYVEQLRELDTSNVEPTYQTTVELQNIWRDDEVGNELVTREQLLVLAPDTADNQVKVPKVL